MKHTPGPWFYTGKNLVKDSHGNCIHGDSSFIDNNANAQLIAAAPELLEIVEKLIKTLPSDDNSSLETMMLKGRAKKLIAKARGYS